MTEIDIEFYCSNCGETLPPKRIKFISNKTILVVCKECEYAMRFEH